MKVLTLDQETCNTVFGKHSPNSSTFTEQTEETLSSNDKYIVAWNIHTTSGFENGTDGEVLSIKASL